MVLKYAAIAGLLSLSVPVPVPVPETAQTVDAVARRYGLAGELLVSRGDSVVFHEAFGTIEPGGRREHAVGERWRLASITKQVTAALIVRDRWATLDQPMPALLGLTLQLLTHHTGLANPDATPPNEAGVPTFYTRGRPDLRYCTSLPPRPGSAFSYNNCDYLLAATLLPERHRWPAGLAMSTNQRTVPGFVGNKPEPPIRLSSYGAAGGLVGSINAVFRFNRSLMAGPWMPAAARTALWQPEGNGSAQALGQWVFTAPLKGCAAPTRIVQRDGEIHGVQARNFILPDIDMTVTFFTNRSSDDFTIGEVWTRSGFAYDLLSAAACADGATPAKPVS